MEEIVSFYWRVLVLAFGDSLDLAGTILLALFLLLGFLSWLCPGLNIRGRKVTAEWAQAWRASVLVLGGILLIRLALSPFWIWQDEHSHRVSAEDALKQPITISFERSNDRPFLEPDAGGQLWVRAKAYNKGPGDVVCRVFLNGLEKLGAPKPVWATGDTLELYWAGNELESGGNLERTVPPGPPGKIFNLALIKKGGGELSIQSSQFGAQVRDKLLPGTYRFTVQANYDKCRSDPADIWVKYDGKQQVSFVDAPSGR